MYLSISLDLSSGAESQQDYRARAAQIETLAPDLVLLAAEDASGTLAPPLLEALVDVAWITAILTTPVVVAGLPAVHGVPFHVARALSAADFLSAGRTGWLPLLGGGAQRDAAYGTAVAAIPAEACARADDFIRATRALWDSWDDDALILDKASGRYLDSTRVRRVDYRGAFFSTKGPLNAARPPQGHPLLVRDLTDRPSSSEFADIVIGTAAELETPGRHAIRLLRTLDEPDAALAAVRDGVADGLHLAGPDALAMLTALRQGKRASIAMTGRARFALPHPENPFTERSQAR